MSDDIRFGLFGVLLALSLVASEMLATEGASPLLTGRVVFGGALPLALGWVLTERKFALGLGPGFVGRGATVVIAGVPLTVAAMYVLALSPAVREFYSQHPPQLPDLALAYAPAVLQVELCLRGVLLFGLLPRLGPVGATAFATIPTGLMHLDKPLAEALGSVPVGLALGAVAMWTRSIWYGFALHLIGSVVLAMIVGAYA